MIGPPKRKPDIPPAGSSQKNKRKEKDTHKAGIQSPNDVINLATASLKDFVKEHPANRMEISHDIRPLNAEKIGGDEVETMMFYELSKHILERMSGGSD